jgi:phosphonate transport system ATP-binding protein
MPSIRCAIDIVSASKSFRERTIALDKVSLKVRPGECVGLLGASGSGKSTLLRSICGLEMLDPNGGSISIDGQVLQEGGKLSPMAQTLRKQTGIIFQQFNLVGRLSVMKNVLSGMLAQTPLWRSLTGHFAMDERLRAIQALEAVGLADLAQRRASTLSGGQQQRVAIARTLAQRARTVLADEPVASLDPESARRVMELLQDLNINQGVTVVTSLHNVGLARRYCDRLIALREGAVVFDDIPAQLNDREVQKIYGERAHELITDASVTAVASTRITDCNHF